MSKVFPLNTYFQPNFQHTIPDIPRNGPLMCMMDFDFGIKMGVYSSFHSKRVYIYKDSSQSNLKQKVMIFQNLDRRKSSFYFEDNRDILQRLSKKPKV